jgi:hypothetical protein
MLALGMAGSASAAILDTVSSIGTKLGFGKPGTNK